MCDRARLSSDSEALPEEKNAGRMALEKVKGKAKEVVAIATGDRQLRAEAERDQIESGVPDLSATAVHAARALAGLS